MTTWLSRSHNGVKVRYADVGANTRLVVATPAIKTPG